MRIPPPGREGRLPRDPTNPTLQVTDIAAVAELVHRHGALLIVDNTFMTPYLRCPWNSARTSPCNLPPSSWPATQTCSPVLRRRTTPTWLPGRSRTAVSSSAARPPPPIDPTACRAGREDLALRLERQRQNACKLIEFLSERPEVEKIFYAGNSSRNRRRCSPARPAASASVFVASCSRTAAARRPSPVPCPSS